MVPYRKKGRLIKNIYLKCRYLVLFLVCYLMGKTSILWQVVYARNMDIIHEMIKNGIWLDKKELI